MGCSVRDKLNDILTDMKILDELKEALRVNGKAVVNSYVYLGLYSEKWKDDPIPLLQMGLAIILDKPIAIISVRGAKIPEHLKKLAFAVDYANTAEDLKEVAERMTQKIGEVMKENGYK